MSEQHTTEPWPFGATPINSKEDAISLFKQSLDVHEGSIGEHFFEIYNDEARRIAFLIGPTALANSRRIVACVNACAGIPTSRIEAGAADILAYSMELKLQRDELLALLERASVSLGSFTSDMGWAQSDMDTMDSIDAAIAIAKGGAA